MWQVVTAAHSVSKVPENSNGTDMNPAMNAAQYLVEVEDKEGASNNQVVAAREKEAKANKLTAESIMDTCRIPTLCSNQTEMSEASLEEAVMSEPVCRQV